MADLNKRNILASAILAQVRAISSPLVKFTSMNSFIVPEMIEPPPSYTGTLLQIKFPESSFYGQGGGYVLQRVSVPFALFYRMSADPKMEYQGVLSSMEEIALVIQKVLLNFSASNGLAINLFLEGEQVTARPVTTLDGERLKDCVMCSWRMWGTFAQTWEDFGT